MALEKTDSSQKEIAEVWIQNT